MIEQRNKQEERRKRQEEHDACVAECKLNYQRLSPEFARFVTDSFGCDNFSREKNKDFWAKASELKEELKNSKLFKENRDELWHKRQEACERVIHHQEMSHDKYKLKSDDHRIAIINRAGLARVNNLFGFDPETVDSMKRCGKLIKEAWGMLSEYKHEMSHEDKDKCFEYITDVQEEVNAWWNNYKGHQANRHSDFETRTRNRIYENRERLKKANDALDRVRANIDKLEADISNAWIDDYRDRASGWLSEAEDKARDIEASIERIESWIAEDEAKLR